MPKVIKTTKLLKALKKLGFEKIRQKGSHLFLEHNDGRTTTVPLHKEIRPKLLTKIIKQDLKITIEEFYEQTK